jgi:hypothetical protein
MQPKVGLQVGGGTESLLTYVTLMGLLSYKHNINIFYGIIKQILGPLKVHTVISVDQFFQKLVHNI